MSPGPDRLTTLPHVLAVLSSPPRLTPNRMQHWTFSGLSFLSNGVSTYLIQVSIQKYYPMQGEKNSVYC